MFTIHTDINPAFQIRSNAERHPDRMILTFESPDQPDHVMAYQELVSKGNRLAAVLKSSGIGPGDTFAVMMNNQPEIVLALYAALATGSLLVPLDPGCGWEKLVYFLRNSDAKGVIFSPDKSGNPQKALSVQPNIKILGIKKQDDLDTDLSGMGPDLSDILNDSTGKRVEPSRKPSAKHAMILYTSGTSGIPKGIRIRTADLYNFLFLAANVFQYTSDDCLYTGLPMTHGNAYSITIVPSIALGIPAVISRSFDKKRVWDICRQYKCTSFSLMGSLIEDVYREPERPHDAVHPVKKIITAGTPKHIWQKFERRFNVAIHEWYGTLEGGFAHKPPGRGPVGSIGKPIEKHMEVKVVHEDHTQCTPGKTGELLYRFKDRKTVVEYQQGPVVSPETSADGWIRSNDMVHQDHDGWLFFDYRKGQNLRNQGEFISPLEVESVFLTHPDVREACAYGIETPSGSPGDLEVVVAITPRNKTTPDINEIFAFSSKRLPSRAMPAYIQLVESIPRTVSEKVIHRLLKEGFNTESPNVYSFKI
ncbi:MAG: AMP-binding protein [Pseudomonadota bacterium]